MKLVKIEGYIPRELKAEIKKFQKSQNVSESEIVRTALEKMFSQKEELLDILYKELVTQKKAFKVLGEKTDVFFEFFHKFMQVYFLHAPKLMEKNIKEAELFSAKKVRAIETAVKENMEEYFLSEFLGN